MILFPEDIPVDAKVGDTVMIEGGSYVRITAIKTVLVEAEHLEFECADTSPPGRLATLCSDLKRGWWIEDRATREVLVQPSWSLGQVSRQATDLGLKGL